MHRKFLITLAVLLGSSGLTVQASNPFFQDKDEWFRKMAGQSVFPIDPSAVAVILYEKCTYDLESGFKLDNSLRREFRQVIKIVKKGGVGNGDVRIVYPSSPGSQIDIKNIKGTTYNLVGNELVKKALTTDNIARDKTSFMVQSKFSMPAVEEGSVLDISYVITAPTSLLFANWEFQHAIPALYSELEVWVPGVYPYLAMKQGSAMSYPEFNDSKKSLTEADFPLAYSSSETTSGTEVRHERWIRRNIAAVSVEPMAPCISNFEERIQLRINTLQLGSFSFGIMDNWKKVNQSLYESFNYYQPIIRRYPRIKEQTDAVTLGLTNPLDKAKAIYRFVRNTMNRTGYTSIYTSDDMDKIFANKSGSPSEINFLLLTMMRYADIPAQPVAIATTDQRGAISAFPDINQFNHTICMLQIEGNKIFLDASSRYAPFAQLPREDYNGYGRLVAKEGSDMSFDGSALSERSLITVTTEKPDPKDYVLHVAYTFGPIEAHRLREEWIKDSGLVRNFIRPAIGKMGMDARLLSCSIGGLNDPDTTLSASFNIHLTWPDNGKAYFNPHFISSISQNPFLAAKRSLPVELPAMQDAYVTIQMKVPEGYKMEESPKPALIKMNGADYYKYIMAYEDGNHTMQVSTRVHTERTWYPPEDYPLIKEFYEKVITQQEATYVFSK
jgi:hypothetical protein